MSLMPAATWRGPIVNKTPGGMLSPVYGLVLHVEQGSESGTNSWFHNPTAQASSHFGNPKSGPLDEWVDTKDKAWAEAAGNPRWYSVEHEGSAPEVPTDNQIKNDAHLYAWLLEHHGVPMQTTNDINRPGLGWHGMGGDLWGGHPLCPGSGIKDARPEILTLALSIVHGTVDQQPPNPVQKKHHDVPKFPGTLEFGSTGADVRELQTQLHKRGWKITVDGDFGAATRQIVAAFQAEKHLLVDGICGKITWHAVFTVSIT